ncbi:YczE/YyaS/YitT family protein [Loigolactobacillus binensis]|uniref:YitT family protein n=1 Tax=Loigolactobacillus binensis TaxID=2559922 RepID=A0ABW3EBX2_9LACO|nr:DUF6198 family protein [Loigolactobacillus binensis]
MNNTWGVGGTTKHFACLIFGIALMAASVAMAKIALLGTSPISSVPNVLSELTPLTIGQWTIVYMVLLIILEWIVLGHYFDWHNVIQIIPSAFFGVMIDTFVRLLHFLTTSNYLLQLLLTLLSIVLLATGVFFEVNSRTLMMAGEGITAAFAFRKKMAFGRMKVRVDVSMVLLALLLSFGFGRQLIGVREGTVLSALLSGRIVGLIETHLPKLKIWVSGVTEDGEVVATSVKQSK